MFSNCCLLYSATVFLLLVILRATHKKLQLVKAQLILVRIVVFGIWKYNIIYYHHRVVVETRNFLEIFHRTEHLFIFLLHNETPLILKWRTLFIGHQITFVHTQYNIIKFHK